MPRSARAFGALLVILAAFLAACGSGASAPSQPAATSPGATADGTSAPAATPDASDAAQPGAPSPGTALDACAIVTPGEVAAVLDASDPYDPGTLKKKPTSLSPGRTECTYTGPGGRVIVSLTPEDGANLYDAARGSYKDAVDVTGTGADGAFLSVQNDRAFVWKGAVGVMLTVFPASGPLSYDHAEAFAKAIVEKL